MESTMIYLAFHILISNQKESHHKWSLKPRCPGSMITRQEIKGILFYFFYCWDQLSVSLCEWWIYLLLLGHLLPQLTRLFADGVHADEAKTLTDDSETKWEIKAASPRDWYIDLQGCQCRDLLKKKVWRKEERKKGYGGIEIRRVPRMKARQRGRGDSVRGRDGEPKYKTQTGGGDGDGEE